MPETSGIINIESLLGAISGDTPSGLDLEYDQDFMALDQAARRKPEQQFGDTIVAAEEPDWDDVRKRAEALFSRTKDLRVGLFLTRALARTGNFVGLAAGLKLVHELLSRYWDNVHPQLDPDDDNDPTMRLNALSQLADAETLVREVRAIHLVAPGRHGKLSVKDILVLAGKLPAAGGEATPTQAEAEGMLRSSASDGSLQIGAARQSQSLVRAIQALLSEKVGTDRAPDMKPLNDILKAVVQLCDTVLPGEEAVEEGVVVMDGTGAPARPAAGELRTRDDVSRLLDRACEFLERTEPSNPAPLLIRRAQRLMSMNFVQILEDLAPDGLGQARNVTGLDKT